MLGQPKHFKRLKFNSVTGSCISCHVNLLMAHNLIEKYENNLKSERFKLSIKPIVTFTFSVALIVTWAMNFLGSNFRE